MAINSWRESKAKRIESAHGGHVDKKMFTFTHHVGAHLADSKYWITFNVEMRRIFAEYEAVL